MPNGFPKMYSWHGNEIPICQTFLPEETGNSWQWLCPVFHRSSVQFLLSLYFKSSWNVCDGLTEQKSLNVDQLEECAHLSKQGSSQQLESIVAVLYYFQWVVCDVEMLLFPPCIRHLKHFKRTRLQSRKGNQKTHNTLKEEKSLSSFFYITIKERVSKEL